VAALEMLNIMETLPTLPDGVLSPSEQHKRIESMKLAYADLYLWVAIIPSVGNRLTLNVVEANNRQRCLAFCCV
jgi:gamma-glutamyltranspeptidase